MSLTKNQSLDSLRAGIRALADPEKKEVLQRFFKTGPGDYGHGDVFLGVAVPRLRVVARRFKGLPWKGLSSLLKSKIHEERLVALLILVDRFQRVDERGRKDAFSFYMRHMSRVNNWDLVDSSAPAIVGGWLAEKSRGALETWARSPNLWFRRIALLATFHFIRRGEFSDTFRLVERLLTDPEDLIHKASGWMLREVGKRDGKALDVFLTKYANRMPRTMLRYAVERHPERERQAWLAVAPIRPRRP
jgi:3-methyladenine DNA glycosylase AlkD